MTLLYDNTVLPLPHDIYHPQPLIRQIKEWKWHNAYNNYKDICKENESILVDWSVSQYENFYIYYVYWFENIDGKFYRNEMSFENTKPQKWWSYVGCDRDLE